jgi:hypothetical protein
MFLLWIVKRRGAEINEGGHPIHICTVYVTTETKRTIVVLIIAAGFRMDG